MKRILRTICIVLVFVTLCSTTALAAEVPESRGSNYFMSSSVYFWNVSSNQYQIWFDVTAKSGMSELGASKIKVQRSTDKVNWTTVRTYNKSDYSQMTTTSSTGVSTYANYVTYYPSSGYYYRAVVTLYARNSSGYGEMDEVTATLNLR